MKEWAGEIFDSKAADIEALAEDVADFAKAWTRKPPVRRKQSN